MRRVLKRVSFIAAGCGVTTVVLLGGLRLWVEQKYRDRIYTCAEDVPPRSVAIVPGAGLWPDGSLTPVLAEPLPIR